MTNSKNREPFLELLEKTPNTSEDVIRKNLVVDVKGTLSEKGETTYSSSKNQSDVLKVKQTKGNIPINKELLNRYKNVNDIFLNENDNYDVLIGIKNINITTKNKNATEFYHTALNIFKENHNTNIFFNDGNEIRVSNQDIKESINKIFNDRLQNQYLTEHLQVFSDLGDIIEKSKLVNQTFEGKNRTKYNTWNYYFKGLNIGGEIFDFEFDVVSRLDGENHYRLQRLKKADIQSTLPINGEVDFGTSAFYENNVS